MKRFDVSCGARLIGWCSETCWWDDRQPGIVKRELLNGGEQVFLANNDSRITNNVRYPALDALLLFFLLNLVLQPLVEPDFGWHLRTGLDLLRNGWRLPECDPYSHTMPDWPWVEHAWLTDGLIGL